jgi:hypothetical protein
MEEIDSKLNTMIKNRVFFVPIRQGWLARSLPELKHPLLAGSSRYSLPFAETLCGRFLILVLLEQLFRRVLCIVSSRLVLRYRSRRSRQGNRA